MKLVKNEVIRAGGGRIVSDGMREWAIVGWYGMAAFAAVRATCCPSSSPELHIPFKDATCDLDGALKRIATAATSATAEDTEVATALQASLPGIVKLQLGTGAKLATALKNVAGAGAAMGDAAVSAGGKAIACVKSAVEMTAGASASISVDVKVSASVSGSAKTGS